VKIYDLYLANTRYINNWDLVDSSAHKIVGPYLENRDRAILQTLTRSKSLWERRIAIIATFHFIRINQFDDSLNIAKQLLYDKEDLIHKAVGWMLREIGKREKNVEIAFLKKHYRSMPRTMLRYSIEKFSPQERNNYLRGLV
jgi:3-methyladenine DNA glycosylase AlkD